MVGERVGHLRLALHWSHLGAYKLCCLTIAKCDRAGIVYSESKKNALLDAAEPVCFGR